METYSGPPVKNGETAERFIRASAASESVGNETRKETRTSISAARDLSKHYEEFPELTEESLTRLEQGIWELSLEIVKLRSRIEAYPGLALSNNGSLFGKEVSPWIPSIR
jgi:hypothetical protein